MFVRILEFGMKPEKKAEYIKVLKNEVLPILKKQTGFLEILPFFPENVEERCLNLSIWATKLDAERYQREVYAKVLDIVKPFLTTPVTARFLVLEPTLCEHFVETFAA